MIVDQAALNSGEITVTGEKENLVTRDNIYLLIGAIILGGIFNFLFYKKGLGISYPIFVLVLYGVIIFNLRDKIEFKISFETILTVPIILLSLTYLIFSNYVFWFLNFMIIPALIFAQTVLITKNNYYKWFDPRFIFDLLIAIFVRTLNYMYKPIILLSQIKKRNIESDKKASVVTKVIIGLLISVPLVFVVIILLSEADKVFEYWIDSFVRRFINLNLADFIAQLIIGVFVCLTAFSYLWSLRNDKDKDFCKSIGDNFRVKKILDPIIVLTVLITVNMIYVVFTVIQFSYLFGSISSLLPEGVTYAEYARRGFFELVAVTIINVSILIGIINLTKIENSIISGILKIMNSCLVACTMVMLLSAHFRMSLYEQEYGYTYLRVFTHAFMLFIFAILVVTLIKVWKENFCLIKSYIVISIIAYLAINFFNVDVFIADNNIKRYKADNSKTIDTEYLSNLSNDAVPYLVKLLDDKNEEVVKDVKYVLNSRKKRLESKKDWQSFNISDFRAKNVLEKYNFEDKKQENMGILQ